MQILFYHCFTYFRKRMFLAQLLVEFIYLVKR